MQFMVFPLDLEMDHPPSSSRPLTRLGPVAVDRVDLTRELSGATFAPIAHGDKKRRPAENLTGVGREMTEILKIAGPGDGKMALMNETRQSLLLRARPAKRTPGRT